MFKALKAATGKNVFPVVKISVWFLKHLFKYFWSKMLFGGSSGVGVGSGGHKKGLLPQTLCVKDSTGSWMLKMCQYSTKSPVI